jgi:hypothetical protein
MQILVLDTLSFIDLIDLFAKYPSPTENTSSSSKMSDFWNKEMENANLALMPELYVFTGQSIFSFNSEKSIIFFSNSLLYKLRAL